MVTGIHCKHWDYHAISFKEKKCKAGINPLLSYCDNNPHGWIMRTPCLKTNEGAAAHDGNFCAHGDSMHDPSAVAAINAAITDLEARRLKVEAVSELSPMMEAAE